MNSYNTFTCIFILVTNLCFFRYLEYGTELILITNLYLLRSLIDDKLILIPISRRIHTYACIRRILIQVSQRTYIYRTYTDICLRLIIIQISQRTYIYRTYTDTCLRLIIIQISQRTYISDLYLNFCQTDTYPHTRTYIYLRSSVGVHRTYAHTEVPLCTTKLILIP